MYVRYHVSYGTYFATYENFSKHPTHQTCYQPMSIVTVSVFHYPFRAQFRAFANMGRFMLQPFNAPGLRFQKLLGSGQNFGVVPDFSRYVFLGVWDDEMAADTFFNSATSNRLTDGTDAISTLYLQPLRSHGCWDGQNPFVSTNPQSLIANPKLPIAVLTRATIRWAALPDFWRYVPLARQRLHDQKAQLLFAVGVGEKPLVQQCTISVWRDASAVDQFAYRQSGHKEVVRLTRQRRWYNEELFARFMVIRAEGALFHEIGTELVRNKGQAGIGMNSNDK